MKANKISVIVPVFNVENYLEKCVKSIIEQTYKNLEVILVDDGSTDKSGFLCDELKKQDYRIKVIHKTNEGCQMLVMQEFRFQLANIFHL